MRYNFKISGEKLGVKYGHELRDASYLRIISFCIVRFRFKYMNK